MPEDWQFASRIDMRDALALAAEVTTAIRHVRAADERLETLLGPGCPRRAR